MSVFPSADSLYCLTLSVFAIFRVSPVSYTHLVDLSGVLLNCHFFCLDQIEFDIAPSEVTDEAKFHGIVDFMHDLSNVLEKTVVLTSENAPEVVLFCAVPNFEVVCCFDNYQA